ncbi:MAG TPA: hypothetical protein VEW69_00745, partial [Alphaproteobacteria bacterium]|nr:hypothetical protein [Alphaproteobacteria bacterium]
MPNVRLQKLSLLAFFALTGLAALVWAIGQYGHVSIPVTILLVLRWLALLGFCGYALVRRSL